MACVVELSIVAAGCITPDHTARLLKTAVGIDQLGASEAKTRYRLKAAIALQPSIGHLGIVVEEDEKITAPRRRALVTGADEAQVLLVPQGNEPLDTFQNIRCRVSRAVIDNNYLVLWVRCEPGNRVEACQCILPVIKNRNNDRHVDPVKSSEPGQV